jgi:hypothetical protein
MADELRLFVTGGTKTASLMSSLRLGPRVQRNVFASGRGMERFKRPASYNILAIPLSGPPGFSVRRRLRRRCQIHIS